MAISNKQKLNESIRKLVRAGQEAEVEVLDFSDPNRPKSVLEVDFPILSVNQIANIEGNAGKPIYQMSKWWARRRSSVFRAMLLAAAMKAPEDPINAAKSVWDVYYANHQKKNLFNQLKVADIFMGGGTTLVEGSRLGMQMYGNDLNPIAWLVVKNELSNVNIDEVKKVTIEIEKEVKPQIMPYFACDCPRGHKGKWLKFKSTEIPISPYYDEITIGEPSENEMKSFYRSISNFEKWKNWYEIRGYQFEIMDERFSPLKLTNDERPFYRYWGPEIIFTFFAKHGPCQASGCNHRTPIMTSPVVVTKKLSLKAWEDHLCITCGHIYDIEQKEARIAPAEPLVIAEKEKSFTIVNDRGEFECPSCNSKQTISVLGNQQTKNKKVNLSLLIHTNWLKGSSLNKGGSVTDSNDEANFWNKERDKNLMFVEIRGELPDEVTCPRTGMTFSTKKGTVPKRSTFTCQSNTCGRDQNTMESIKNSKKSAPISAYLIQGYCSECNDEKQPYNGKFFMRSSYQRNNASHNEWNTRKNNDLNKYWPKSSLPYGMMTHIANGNLPENYGYTHWWTMFNETQLLILSQLLKKIMTFNSSIDVLNILYGIFQQYLRYQNMFVFWHHGRDCPAAHMSNNNYHPKANVVEGGVFSEVGTGNWNSSVNATLKGLEWSKDPYELVTKEYLNEINIELSKEMSQKSTKVYLKDGVIKPNKIKVQSSTDLDYIDEGELDLVITDPPFGGLLHYSELSDFFYVWMRIGLKHVYPELFMPEHTIKSLEAVSNKARHPEDADGFYRRLLTGAWKEAYRTLKSGGILAFTFHHSADEPWIDVLESLFESGFYLEATYPIRSDETKGDSAQFGSKTIEYDIIHVCRKRIEDPLPISWAKLRRQILRDVRQLQDILQNHLKSGLTEADLQVIKRGKALEYYSKHYGKVYVEEGRDFSVQEALVGINHILDDEVTENKESPPLNAEVFTGQFLRIFHKTIEVKRSDMQNYLRGTGVSANFFEDRIWCHEQNKVFHLVSPLDFAQNYKGKSKKGLSYDLDQSLMLIGGAYENSGININDTLNNDTFKPHPALGDLLGWFSRNGGTKEIKQAALRAKQIFDSWIARNQRKHQEQMVLFDLEEEI